MDRIKIVEAVPPATFKKDFCIQVRSHVALIKCEDSIVSLYRKSRTLSCFVVVKVRELPFVI